MSLIAPNNTPGKTKRYGLYRNTWRIWSEYDGYVQKNDSWYDTRIENVHEKSPTSKTHVRILNGKPWRDPTSYSRHLNEYSYKPSYSKTVYAPNPQWMREERSGLWFNSNPEDLNFAAMSDGLGILTNTDGYNQAIVECKLRLNEGRVELGTYLAETKQSAEMIAGMGTDLAQLLLRVKRGQFAGFPKEFGLALRKGRDAYLQWNFGWKPLCQDIHDAVGEFMDHVPLSPMLSATRQISTPFDYETRVFGDRLKVQVRHTDRCKLWASLSAKALTDLQSYGLANPASLAWELVPYSFVVDWFAPVGNVLRSLTATAGLDFVGGCSTQLREGQATLFGTLGECTKKFKYFDRRAHGSFPIGGYYGKQNPLSLDKGQKLLALLSQLF